MATVHLWSQIHTLLSIQLLLQIHTARASQPYPQITRSCQFNVRDRFIPVVQSTLIGKSHPDFIFYQGDRFIPSCQIDCYCKSHRYFCTTPTSDSYQTRISTWRTNHTATTIQRAGQIHTCGSALPGYQITRGHHCDMQDRFIRDAQYDLTDKSHRLHNSTCGTDSYARANTTVLTNHTLSSTQPSRQIHALLSVQLHLQITHVGQFNWRDRFIREGQYNGADKSHTGHRFIR